MKFRLAFIQKQNRLRIEEELLCDYLEVHGIPIEFITQKQINRRRLPLTKDVLVVGDISCVTGALKQLSVEAPPANTYPAALAEYMGREIWETTLGQLETAIYNGGQPVFAKPADRQKRFTGQVFRSIEDLYFLHSISKKTKVQCATVVNFTSEYRVYVVYSKIRKISHYEGDDKIDLNRDVVERAISDLDQANASYAGYGIDFGVLDTGETVLVEMNDGFGLGAYGINSKDYSELVIARWSELMAGSDPVRGEERSANRPSSSPNRDNTASSSGRI